jgi:hypothetical protein
MHERRFSVRMDPARADRPMFFSPSGYQIPEVPPKMVIDGRPLGVGRAVPRWEEDVPLSFYL